ncbi:MAG: spore cortex-lytic enzyme [Eubacteriales bacterium]|nr:spore cortex-lytic enzyme [Eubacteriales bacterium]
MNRKKRIIILLLFVLLAVSFASSNHVSFNYYSSVGVLSRYGSRGQEVINIQTRLKKWGYYKGSVDGIYGYQTYTAVKQFQSKNGLAADGIAGPKTLAAIGLPTGTTSSVTPKAPTASTVSNQNLNLLARAVYSEARGEPYTGQVAIAAVVLNRVRDSRFPNTISGVIYQPGAFTAVADGQFNLTPNETAYKAARDALNGWDPTYGCVYYFNPATATSGWIWSRQIVIKIGKHNFCK